MKKNNLSGSFGFWFLGCKVTAKKNLGKHVEEVLGEESLRLQVLTSPSCFDTFFGFVKKRGIKTLLSTYNINLSGLLAMQVLKRLVLDRGAHLDPKPTLSLVPQASLAEFWLPLTAFHLGESAKNGCLGLKCLDIVQS